MGLWGRGTGDAWAGETEGPGPGGGERDRERLNKSVTLHQLNGLDAQRFLRLVEKSHFSTTHVSLASPQSALLQLPSEENSLN